VVRLFSHLGFRIGWDFSVAKEPDKLMLEVYPHPAMVRLFNLKERIAYKRGRVAERRIQFARLQCLLRELLRGRFQRVRLDPETDELLNCAWSKNVEDQTDAFFCALIGYWHWIHLGGKSEILGDLASGFILIPKP
jgi:predicted RNase H-like nuclease